MIIDDYVGSLVGVGKGGHLPAVHHTAIPYDSGQAM